MQAVGQGFEPPQLHSPGQRKNGSGNGKPDERSDPSKTNGQSLAGRPIFENLLQQSSNEVNWLWPSQRLDESSGKRRRTRQGRRKSSPRSRNNWPPALQARATIGCKCGEHATKSKWWMPWHREATKDAINCDKPRLAVRKHLTRGSPNRATGRPKEPSQSANAGN